MKNIVFIIMISSIFIACGGGDTSSSDSNNDLINNDSSSSKTAYFIDNAVENIFYYNRPRTNYEGVLISNVLNGYTNVDGAFKYNLGDDIVFKIGNNLLGIVKSEDIKDDKKLFLTDLLGLNRNEINNPDVIKLSQILLSLDVDQDESNGIKIDNSITLPYVSSIKEYSIVDLETIFKDKLVSAEYAFDHLKNTAINNNIDYNTAITGNIDEGYYGVWTYTDSDKIEHSVKISPYTVLDDYIILDENTIILNEDGKKYVLHRKYIGTADLSGSIIEQIEARKSRAVSDIGDIDVILTNIITKKEQKSVVSDNNFTFNDIDTGEYEINIKPQDDTVDEIVFRYDILEDTNIGDFQLLKDSPNYKSFFYDDNFIMAGEITRRIIQTVDISNYNGGDYNISFDSNESIFSQYQSDIGYTRVNSLLYEDRNTNAYSLSSLELSYPEIFVNQKSVDINVSINNGVNKWKDILPLDIYKRNIQILIEVGDENIYNMDAYIIGKNNLYKFNSTSDYNLYTYIPTLSDESYTLVIINGSNSEIPYTIKVDGNNKDRKYKIIAPTSNYNEPNEDINNATTLVLDDSIVSKLDASDKDIWQINTIEDYELGKPNYTNLTTKMGMSQGDSFLSDEVVVNSIMPGDHKFLAKLTTFYDVNSSGTLVVNGVDSNTTEVEVKYGDKIQIKDNNLTLDEDGYFPTYYLIIGKRGALEQIIKDFIDYPNFRDVTTDKNTEIISDDLNITGLNETFTITLEYDNQNSTAVLIKNDEEISSNTTTVENGDIIKIKADIKDDDYINYYIKFYNENNVSKGSVSWNLRTF